MNIIFSIILICYVIIVTYLFIYKAISLKVIFGGKYYIEEAKFNKETGEKLGYLESLRNRDAIKGYIICVNGNIVEGIIVPDAQCQNNQGISNIFNNTSLKICNDCHIEIINSIVEIKLELVTFILDIIKMFFMTIIAFICYNLYEDLRKFFSSNIYIVLIVCLLVSLYVFIKVGFFIYKFGAYKFKIKSLLYNLEHIQ